LHFVRRAKRNGVDIKAELTQIKAASLIPC
jgi:hypothetical protein